MEPKFRVQLKIRKPVADVFDAVVKPDRLSGYFVRKASGPLTEGAVVKWSFDEAPETYDVIVRHVIKNERIVFEWPTNEGGYNTRVEMAFKTLDDGATLVQISESGWRPTPEGIKSSYDNAGGWMHMLVCLKGYLEHGINLRAGGTGHACS